MSALRFRALIATLGEPSELTVTQEVDTEGLAFERVVARWDLPDGGSCAFHGTRYGIKIGDAYADLLKRIRKR